MIHAEKLVTHRYRIEETAKAYQTVASAGESLKVVITFE
jgi:threonine dehydrogenase-like Zn-dependent dehydrogenase